MAVWERQEGESKPAYDAFWAYCSIGKGEKRSYSRVARKLKKSVTLIHRWGGQWNWQERTRAYDNHLMEVELAALKKQRVEAARRHARIARSFQEKVIKRLVSVNPDELTPKDLTTWLDVAVKIERQALGEPTEIIAQELSGPGGGPIEHKRDWDLSALSKEELIDLENTLLKIEAAGSK